MPINIKSYLDFLHRYNAISFVKNIAIEKITIDEPPLNKAHSLSQEDQIFKNKIIFIYKTKTDLLDFLDKKILKAFKYDINIIYIDYESITKLDINDSFTKNNIIISANIETFSNINLQNNCIKLELIENYSNYRKILFNKINKTISC